MKKTILIVDDKLNVQIFLKELLCEHGFRVVTADSGREARFVAYYEKPNVILVNAMMQQMDGHEFIQTYRKEHDTPIILLTTLLKDRDRMFEELGVGDWASDSEIDYGRAHQSLLDHKR